MCLHTAVRARASPNLFPLYSCLDDLGGSSPTLMVLCCIPGMFLCAHTCVCVGVGVRVSVSVCSPVGACVRAACPGQPELIIVVVTMSPLIPRIPLPPARRGLQINKSSLGAGASEHTYVPAGGQHGDFRPAVGTAREQGPCQPHTIPGHPRGPGSLPPTPLLQLLCGAELWRAIPVRPGDRSQPGGQLSPIGLEDKAWRRFGEQDLGSPNKVPWHTRLEYSQGRGGAGRASLVPCPSGAGYGSESNRVPLAPAALGLPDTPHGHKQLLGADEGGRR